MSIAQGRRKTNGRILAPRSDGKVDGYVTYRLYLGDGSVKNVKAHRLVAEAFVPNPEGLSQVNHIDGDKRNNKASNLEWVSPNDNNNHAYKTGLKPSVGDACYGRKVLCVETGVVYDSLRKAALSTDTKSPNAMAVNIGRCLNGRGPKTAGGYHWKAVGDNRVIRKIVCKENGKVFSTGVEAAKYLVSTGAEIGSIPSAAGRIREVAAGKGLSVTACGYHWGLV